MLLIMLLVTACGAREQQSDTVSDTASPGVTAPPQPAAEGPQTDPTQAPVTAEEAYALLANAGGVEQAHEALQLIYAQLGIGLYTADGEQLLAGAEQGPDDFYLYEGESELLAGAFVSGDRFPVDRIAGFIGEAGYGNLDQEEPLTPDEMLAMLGDAVRRARENPDAFTFRLVDALGKAHQPALDLTAQGLDPATTYLDAAQLFLVLYDILGDEAGAQARISGPHLAILAPPPQTDPCDFPGVPDLARKAGFFAASKLLRFGRYISIAGQALDSLHDALVMLGYTVTLEPESANTHWKHEPNEPDTEVTFKAHVDFDLGKLNNLARCGKLAGFKFPEQGPAEGVSVEWEIDPLLEEQGAWQQGSNTYTTDAGGDATITFSPKVESRPKDGLNVTEHGWVFARIMPRSVLNPRKVFDLLGVGPEFHLATAGLEVSRHVNLTMTISGKLTHKEGGASFIFPKTEIPLSVGESEITGSGQMDIIFEITGLPPGCLVDAGAPATLSVTGTGMDPINFTVDGLAQLNMKGKCSLGGTTVEMDMPAQPPTAGQPLTFSLSPKDGAKYSFTTGVATGSIDFTLSEN